MYDRPLWKTLRVQTANVLCGPIGMVCALRTRRHSVFLQLRGILVARGTMANQSLGLAVCGFLDVGQNCGLCIGCLISTCVATL